MNTVKGRIEKVPNDRQITIHIDFAHTPDSLKNVLKTVNVVYGKRIITVFGCGGDRDKTKRPIMGQIAQENADVVYVTDDNPRTENTEDIRKQVMAGCPCAYNIGDRERAIQFAMGQAEKGDVVIVAGKGHETGQYVNGKILPFNDEEIIKKYL